MCVERAGLRTQPLQRRALGADDRVALADLGVEDGDALGEKASDLAVVGRDFEQPSPPQRVRPRLADRAAAFVAWACRRALPTEAIIYVKAPQTPVVPDPRRLVIDQDGGPGGGLTRSDRDTVASRVIDEWDAEPRFALCRASPPKPFP